MSHPPARRTSTTVCASVGQTSSWGNRLRPRRASRSLRNCPIRRGSRRTTGEARRQPHPRFLRLSADAGREQCGDSGPRQRLGLPDSVGEYSVPTGHQCLFNRRDRCQLLGNRGRADRGISVDQPASVLIGQSGSTATVCLADPRQNIASIMLTRHRPVAAVTNKDTTVTVLRTGRNCTCGSPPTAPPAARTWPR
ncbi:polysaccharide lyase beta-sandwich domain-containing protein [Allorhizocola rhizosphaerae]|uniref:polysaccharide lyase beta-sandwich domain-containing protein n=1 Tax=Allorhizocola rhizosphaerae TaxID=1872709 RepID=UPI00248266F5|nr:polysaccharide lyase beta-sandwich domain-containing protein [Allorhizocola rhizosphaerae]